MLTCLYIVAGTRGSITIVFLGDLVKTTIADLVRHAKIPRVAGSITGGADNLHRLDEIQWLYYPVSLLNASFIL